MSRAFWFVAGAGSSLYLMAKARRAREALTSEGLQDRLAGLSLGAHLFREEVRTHMATRETQLRRRELSGPVSPVGATHADTSAERSIG